MQSFHLTIELQTSLPYIDKTPPACNTSPHASHEIRLPMEEKREGCRESPEIILLRVYGSELGAIDRDSRHQSLLVEDKSGDGMLAP